MLRRALAAAATVLAVAALPLVAPAAPHATAGPRPADPSPGRFNDVQPHFGGAAIGPYGSTPSYACTSGMAVLTKTGKRAMITAGHCFGQDTRLGSGKDPAGRLVDYGTVTRRLFDATPGVDGTQDMELITGVTGRPQTYAATAWVEPDVPQAARVVGTRGVAPDDMVCFSGMKSGLYCDFKVVSTDQGRACDAETGKLCTKGLASAVQIGAVGPLPGDSGSPVFMVNADGTLVIVGMLIGGLVTDKGSVMGFHTVRQIEDPAKGLGVTVLAHES